MRVILKENLKKTGQLGDLVNVKRGYARNYLIPYGKAIEATEVNLVEFEKRKAEFRKIEEQKLKEARAKSELIKNKVLNIKAQVGESGKLFGSIGAKEIVENVLSLTGVKIEKKHVHMPAGIIRKIGEFSTSISFHPEISVNISVVVEPEKK